MKKIGIVAGNGNLPLIGDNQAEKEDKSKKNTNQKPEQDRNRILFFTILIVSVLLIIQLFILPEMAYKRLGYSEFYSIVQNNPTTGKVVECELVENPHTP